MFEKKKWTGQNLLNKIWLIYFMVGYFVFIGFSSRRTTVPEGQPVPPEVLKANEEIMQASGMFFQGYSWIFVLLAFLSLSIKLKIVIKYSGKRLWKGRMDLGRGRTENFRRIILKTISWEEATGHLIQNVEEREAKQLELKKKEAGDSEDAESEEEIGESGEDDARD